RHELLQVPRLGVGRPTRPPRRRLERTALGRAGLPLRCGRCPRGQGARAGARARGPPSWPLASTRVATARSWASNWGTASRREVGPLSSPGSARRGLSGVDWVVSDAHGGLVAALQRQFQGCTWQRCQTHLAGDILEAAPKGLRQELHAQLRALFEAPDLPTARVLLQNVLQTYTARAPKAMAILEAGFDDATAVLALPEPYRRRLRTSNGVERPERRSAPTRARHPHLPQPRVGHSPAGCVAPGAARAVDDGTPLLRHGGLLALASGPRGGAD